ATEFIQKEEQRRKQIIHSLSSFDHTLFEFHYGLLQLCDNLSLYICLNEPDVSKEVEHSFFRNGIPLSESLNVFQEDKLDIQWADEKTVIINECPFSNPLTVTIKQKTISKEAIAAKGLLNSYKEAEYEKALIRFVER